MLITLTVYLANGTQWSVFDANLVQSIMSKETLMTNLELYILVKIRSMHLWSHGREKMLQEFVKMFSFSFHLELPSVITFELIPFKLLYDVDTPFYLC